MTTLRDLKYLAGYVIISSLALFMAFGLIMLGNKIGATVSPHEVMYDCRLAEISPDYPLQVKEGCRKISADQYKKEHQ
jgi:hypothetical protein